MQDDDRTGRTGGGSDGKSRPPSGISVTELFERWLPEAFAASGRTAVSDAPVVRATISGTDGGSWDLRLTDDGLHVERVERAEKGDREAPDVLVRMAAVDVLAAVVTPDPDLPVMIPPGWSVLDLLFLDPRDVALVRQVNGRIAVEIEGKRRRRFRLDVGFGKAGVSAGQPRATVRLDGATFEAVRTGTMAPVQPLLDGRIKLEGDRALAMQLLLLLGSRLGRR